MRWRTAFPRTACPKVGGAFQGKFRRGLRWLRGWWLTVAGAGFGQAGATIEEGLDVFGRLISLLVVARLAQW